MHGSIFLGANRLVPLAASASNAAGRRIDYEEFAPRLIYSIEERFAVRFYRDTLSSAEKEFTEKLEAEKYSTEQWTRRR